MNKFVVIGIVLVLIIGGGFLWKQFGVDSENRPIETGVVKEITIVAKKLQWNFEPDRIVVDQGDRIKLTVINEDDFDHGFAIDAFGVSQRLPASETIFIEFVVTKSGEFPFYCSVSCGSGIVDEKERGHFDQIGRFIARMLGVGDIDTEEDDHEHGADDDHE